MRNRSTQALAKPRAKMSQNLTSIPHLLLPTPLLNGASRDWPHRANKSSKYLIIVPPSPNRQLTGIPTVYPSNGPDEVDLRWAFRARARRAHLLIVPGADKAPEPATQRNTNPVNAAGHLPQPLVDRIGRGNQNDQVQMTQIAESTNQSTAPVIRVQPVRRFIQHQDRVLR